MSPFLGHKHQQISGVFSIKLSISTYEKGTQNMPKRIEAPLVNTKTGELINTSRLIELEDGDHVITKKQREFLQKRDARYQDSTNFVWLSFQYGTNIDFHVEEAVAVRFLYFSTACGMDGIIQKNKLMTAKISLDKNQQTVFVKQTISSGLLRQDGSTFYVNPQIISWGKYKAGFDHIRVFSQYYRRLCESTKAQAELKRIYYLIQMIPYLNRKTNILAHNQTEQDPDRIAHMTFNDFCRNINFNTAHAAKLKKQLSAFRVDDELVIGFFDNITELTLDGRNVVLNPNLFFGGDRSVETYKEICGLFENEKRAYLLCLQQETTEDLTE